VRLGFKSRTISRWCRERKVHGVKMGRVWRIPIREVERLEREWRLSARAS
jgi:hypothetical protein